MGGWGAISEPDSSVCLLFSILLLFLNAMLTFDNVEAAQRAKESLQGADIYSGCCTLKIDFAKVSQSKTFFTFFSCFCSPASRFCDAVSPVHVHYQLRRLVLCPPFFPSPLDVARFEAQPTNSPAPRAHSPR